MDKEKKDKYKLECEATIYNTAITFIEAGTQLGLNPTEAFNIVSESLEDSQRVLNNTNKDMQYIKSERR